MIGLSSANATALHIYKYKQDIPYPDEMNNSVTLTDKTMVQVVKSFKNSSGFYKINGTLENQGAMIFSDIKVIKYYKIPSVNDTTLICYQQDIVSCDYKSINQLPQKSFLLSIPDVNMKSK